MKRFICIGLVVGCATMACADDPASEGDSNITPDAGMDANSASDTSMSGNDTGAEQEPASTTDTATAPDASTVPDALAGDSGKSYCTSYCGCMDIVAPCNTAFENKADCITKCNAQTNWNLSCRVARCFHAKATTLRITA